jgi:hypothetical protein
MTASSIPTDSDSMGPDAQRVAATLVRLEDVFENAAACGVGPQVRRFVYLAAVAGLEVEKVDLSDSLAVSDSGSDQEVLHIWWYRRSRCGFLVSPGLSELYGAEAVRTLPRAKILRKMDVAETDQYLDGLEAVLGVQHLEDKPGPMAHQRTTDPSPAFEDTAGRSKLRLDKEEIAVSASESGFRGAAPSVSSLSGEEAAAALGTLAPAFEDAIMHGVEPQARRFADLTVAADLEVRWVEELRLLTADWRRTGQALFFLRWNPDGQVTGHLGTEEKQTRHGYVRVDPVEKAFGLRYTKNAGTLPEMNYLPTMSTDEINGHTDSFLDWLETFLATHAVPSRQAEARAESEEDNSTDAMMAAIFSTMSFLWIVLIWYSLVWSNDGFGSTLGNVQADVLLLGVFYLVVPVGVLIYGLKVRRAIRRSGNNQGIELARGAITLAGLAILLALVLTVAEFIRNS